MPSDNIAISVRNLTKTYRLFGHPGDRVKQFFSLGLKRYHREFTAVEDVTFDIKKGETVGIIGRNGSGKSTLLQLICGILKPTSGTARVSGRVLALLELGAGFNPEFTGRENVYFQGAVIGFTREQMDKQFDSIVTFADIGDFIDQPVRTYSSGMFVRLAFAVATQCQPDILVVDEALSVGDTHFQRRCFERMHQIRNNGGTILVVSHVMEQIAHHCSRTVWLDHGQLIRIGETVPVLQEYLSALGHPEHAETPSTHPATIATNTDEVRSHPAYNPKERRWGNEGAAIQSLHLRQDGREANPPIRPDQTLEIVFLVEFFKTTVKPIFGLTIKNAAGAPMYSVNSRKLASTPLRELRAGEQVWARFRFLPCLDQGEYLISLGIVNEIDGEMEILDRRYDVLTVRIALPMSADLGCDLPSTFDLVAPPLA